MKVFVIGAGLVGTAVVEALHDDHDLTVLDSDANRVNKLGRSYDIVGVTANASSRRQLEAAGLADSELVIACTSRDEVNIVASAFARGGAPRATTVVRTSSAEYVELWREGRLDADFVVATELETARAVVEAVGLPAARRTDSFADGQVHVVELDVDERASSSVVGRELRSVEVPRDSRVVAILGSEGATLARADSALAPGDRVVLMASPPAALEWCRLLSGARKPVRDAVVYGAGMLGVPIAVALASEGIGVRLLEPDQRRAALVAETLEGIEVFATDGLDREFIERERVGAADVGVFTMRDDALNLYAATLTRRYGIGLSIALAHDSVSVDVYDDAGIDVAIDPRGVTAEEIVRFAHDPRTHQVAMLEGDRYEILDITTREGSAFAGLRIGEMPIMGALIGAIVRGGTAIFPHKDTVLRPGDRAIVFTESDRAAEVERLL
jgi:trk system potassium uptake protein TrkA